MPTFAELKQRHHDLTAKSLILSHLIDHIDNSFRPVAGAEPNEKLLDENNVPVAPAMFEDVVTNVLLKTVSEYKTEIEAILNTDLAPQVAPATAAAAPKRNKNA